MINLRYVKRCLTLSVMVITLHFPLANGEVIEGAFGIELARPLSGNLTFSHGTLRQLTGSVNVSLYRELAPPDPHEYFERYTVETTPISKLVIRISAHTSYDSNTEFGRADCERKAYNLKEVLERRYSETADIRTRGGRVRFTDFGEEYREYIIFKGNRTITFSCSFGSGDFQFAEPNEVARLNITYEDSSLRSIESLESELKMQEKLDQIGSDNL